MHLHISDGSAVKHSRDSFQRASLSWKCDSRGLHWNWWSGQFEKIVCSKYCYLPVGRHDPCCNKSQLYHELTLVIFEHENLLQWSRCDSSWSIHDHFKCVTLLNCRQVLNWVVSLHKPLPFKKSGPHVHRPKWCRCSRNPLWTQNARRPHNRS